MHSVKLSAFIILAALLFSTLHISNCFQYLVNRSFAMNRLSRTSAHSIANIGRCSKLLQPNTIAYSHFRLFHSESDRTSKSSSIFNKNDKHQRTRTFERTRDFDIHDAVNDSNNDKPFTLPPGMI